MVPVCVIGNYIFGRERIGDSLTEDQYRQVRELGLLVDKVGSLYNNTIPEISIDVRTRIEMHVHVAG